MLTLSGALLALQPMQANSGAGQASKAGAKASTSFAVLYPFAGTQASQAEPALEKLGQQIAQKGPWSAAQGRMYTRVSALDQALEQGQIEPSAILLPLSAYLALKARYPKWKARHEVSLVSPQQEQFFLVTDDPKRTSCKRGRVATHHRDDTPFVDQVVTGGTNALADMDWVAQRRPIQVLKTLFRGQADCALIDQAQLKAARKLDTSDSLKVLWSSPKLPSMVVVVQHQTSAWNGVLSSLCRDASSSVCQEVGLMGFSKLRASRIKSIERHYARSSRRSAASKTSAAP